MTAAAFLLSLSAGKVWIAPSAFLEAGGKAVILRELRLPRALLGLGIGATLGLAGAVLQGYLRNPLADPGLLGVSSGAALGAVLALFVGAASFVPAAAVGGAAAAMLLLAALVGRAGSAIGFVLAGVILNSVAGAATALVVSLAPSPFLMGEILDWLMGALTDRSMADVAYALPAMAAGAALLLATGRSLDALALGEAAARSLGVRLGRVQALIIAGSGLAVGAGVAAAGAIGFVGLVVPHLLRPLVGERPSALLLPSALGGAALLLVADSLVRLSPGGTELKLGVAMALVGGPFFLVLLLRLRERLA